MKHVKYGLVFIVLSVLTFSFASADSVGTPEKQTIVYKYSDEHELALDLFLPEQSKAATLVVWVHGGAWMRGSKDDFMNGNGLLGKSLLEAGYAVASVDYRLSGEAIFPAQVADVNAAINYLMDNAKKYSLKKRKIVVMGRSAGGHLASLIATSNNTKDTGFYAEGDNPRYKVIAAVDFFGPSNLVELTGNSGSVDHDSPDSAEAQLLGASPRERVDLARWASPTTYVTKKTPPFLIFHGDNDQTVPVSQSELFHEILDMSGVYNRFYIAEGARHGDPVFDTETYVSKIIAFLKRKVR